MSASLQPGSHGVQPTDIDGHQPLAPTDAAALSRFYVPDDELGRLEPYRDQLDAEYRAAVDERVHKLAVDRDARRLLEAQRWRPPATTANLAAELARPRETHRYRVASLAGWNHNILLSGPRKVGKSQLMVNLAAALSLSSYSQQGDGQGLWTPGAFLGWSECFAGGNVAYLNAEMDADDWRDAFRALPAGAYDPARIFPLHCRGVPLPVITSRAAREWFTAWLREREIEVLIIDTWGAFAAKNGIRNLNDDAEARKITDGLDEIKTQTWVASLFVLIHMPHQTGEKHLERHKGAGAVGDWADALWTYVKDESGSRYLWAEGRARIEQPETALAYRAETGQLWWGSSGSRAQTAREHQRQRMETAILAAGAAGLKAEELKNAAGGHRSDVPEIIAQMESEGLIEIETQGRSRIHRLRLP